MSLGNALRNASKAVLAVEGLGQAVTLKRTTHTPNPATGTTSTSVASYPGRCAIDKYADALVDGTQIQAKDRKVLLVLDDSTVTPKPSDDTLTIGAVVYTIVRSDALQAGSTSVAFQVQARTA